LSALFAATYPERASALILMGCSARGSWAEDYPYKATAAELSTWLSMVEENWGDPIDLSVAAPDAADQEWAAEWQGSLLRYSASPRTAVELARYGFDVDVRDILPTIRVPTLVIQRSGDRWSPIGNGKYLATHIPGAVYAEHDDRNHLIWAGDSEAIVAETRRFLTGLDTALPVERVLMTLMMTDIADSTAKLTELGDQKWVQVLGQHNAIVRDLLKRHGGTEVDNAGDGFLMSFDGPSHALACAQQVHSKMQALDLKVRIGIHMGECERTDHGLKGAAVHLTARILGEATPGTTLVTNTLRDLVVGSRFDFADAGEKALKGIPSKRALFRVSEPFQ
ncbi:MAG: adenylate/guanylate cyclase domain-containing protein, partial [Rhodobacteraceae bacterium]|nr:adenylate/guanylate cyclase domain-containing protein [Paracoccaceae bacterium]